MSTYEEYRIAGVPSTLLGHCFTSWTRENIRVVLDQYGKTYQRGASKLELVHALGELVSKRGLLARDHVLIPKAHATGGPLPELKPVVQQPSTIVSPGVQVVVTHGQGNVPPRVRLERQAWRARRIERRRSWEERRAAERRGQLQASATLMAPDLRFCHQ